MCLPKLKAIHQPDLIPGPHVLDIESPVPILTMQRTTSKSMSNELKSRCHRLNRWQEAIDFSANNGKIENKPERSGLRARFGLELTRPF